MTKSLIKQRKIRIIKIVGFELPWSVYFNTPFCILAYCSTRQEARDFKKFLLNINDFGWKWETTNWKKTEDWINNL